MIEEFLCRSLTSSGCAASHIALFYSCLPLSNLSRASDLTRDEAVGLLKKCVEEVSSPLSVFERAE